MASGNRLTEYEGRALARKRTVIRGKLKRGEEIREEERRLLPPMEKRWLEEGIWHRKYLTPAERRARGQEVTVPYYGHDKRMKPALEAFKEECEPLFARYRDQIRENPDLADRETMAAAFIALIRTATTLNVAERALKELKGVFGHSESKVTVTDTRKDSDLLEGIRERLGRMRSVEARDVTRERLGDGGDA